LLVIKLLTCAKAGILNKKTIETIRIFFILDEMGLGLNKKSLRKRLLSQRFTVGVSQIIYTY